jgi:nucleoside-diphosphate-sugar epimerase
MNVLVIGGAGRVASIIVPYLKAQHTLRVFDLRPPADETLDFVEGNVADIAALKSAAQGLDAVLYMAMGTLEWDTPVGMHTAFDVNVKGLYLTLHAAQSVGVAHAVYCSSMSVYDGNLTGRYFYTEDQMPDARNLYGFTKYLGEEVCRNACNLHGMSVNALRLCLPISDEAWLKNDRSGIQIIATAASDVARAIDAALNYRNSFQAFMISGNYEQTVMSMSKARRVLGWEPLLRQ